MDKTNEHLFYVLECNDGSYYAGYTNDLEKRIRTHNEGKGAKYTRAKLPVRLIYRESYRNKTGCDAGGISVQAIDTGGKGTIYEEGAKY